MLLPSLPLMSSTLPSLEITENFSPDPGRLPPSLKLRLQLADATPYFFRDPRWMAIPDSRRATSPPPPTPVLLVLYRIAFSLFTLAPNLLYREAPPLNALDASLPFAFLTPSAGLPFFFHGCFSVFWIVLPLSPLWSFFPESRSQSQSPESPPFSALTYFLGHPELMIPLNLKDPRFTLTTPL